MACPTCDHTMQCIGQWDSAVKNCVFWCPRCGTLKADWLLSKDDTVPKLVARVIEFGSTLGYGDEKIILNFERLGLRDCITTD